MESKPESPRRRHLMLAGAAGLAASSGVFALPSFAEPVPGETLLVSGRIVDAEGKPLADAWVEGPGANRSERIARTRTDADGRFMLTTSVSQADSYVDYRVSHVHGFARERVPLAYREAPTRFQRDEQGVWRTTFALTVA